MVKRKDFGEEGTTKNKARQNLGDRKQKVVCREQWEKGCSKGA